ncbi:hypothetical protein [Streptomyces sp. NPDC002463]|uniref:hypothetical protein n=1 Tax=Streptomyces sp. NPDC002463 TaxID=3364645 RepID=UPI0036831C7C
MKRRLKRLATPWAAGMAGVVFAVLTATAIVLVRTALPSGADAAEATLEPGQRSAVRTALELIPFAGIAFLWFMGALREQGGEREEKFVSTVFLGSGLIFVATLFGAAAAAWSVLDAGGQGSSFGRDVAYALLTTYAMRMAAVFVLTTSTIGRRLGVLPRPLVAIGYLAGLTLLVVGASVPWSELVFPAWVAVLSLNLLWGRRSDASGPVAST